MWFAIVAGVAYVGTFTVIYFRGRSTAKQVGELTAKLEAADATIAAMDAELERAKSADPSVRRLRELFDEHTPDAA